MNRNIWIRINHILKKHNISHDQFKHINCIRIHPTESDEHFLEKVKICRKLFKNGHQFLTEAWTVDRKRRFDIIDLIDDIIYEIETDNKIDKGDCKTIYTRK